MYAGLAMSMCFVQDHGLAPDHGLVLEISGYLFKSVIFFTKASFRQRGRVDYRSLKPKSAVR